METNTEGSEQPTVDQTRERLRAAAEAEDAGATPEPESKETPASTTKPGEAEHEADGKRAPEAETVKPASSETPTEDEQKPEGKPAEGKPDEQKQEPSKYQKAKKDAARRDRSWQALEREKAAVREQARRIAEYEKSRQAQPPVDPQRQPRFSSGEYWKAAEDFEAAGLKLLKDDPEAAEEKFAFAREARAKAQQVYAAEYQEAQSTAYGEFQKGWTEVAEGVIKDHPELSDPDSELSHDMMELLETYPMLGMHPEGFKYAYEILTLRKNAAEVSELRAQREKDKKEIERLNADRGIQGSQDASKRTGKGVDFNSLGIDEQRERLRRDAEAADAAA